MCTVTYIPTKDGFFLTSNRDESPARTTDLPKVYELRNGACKIVYPRDVEAGGTWIAMASSGQVACLLNGAFVKHQRHLPYRKSRGLILLEYFEGYSPLSFAECVDLYNIEPFTIILINQDEFCELRYDGKKRHIQMLSKSQPYIWSSATLYHEVEAKQKENHFLSWLKSDPSLNIEEIMQFHGLHNSNGYLLDKPCVKTISITSVHMQQDMLEMRYADLLFNSITHIQLSVDHAQASLS